MSDSSGEQSSTCTHRLNASHEKNIIASFQRYTNRLANGRRYQNRLQFNVQGIVLHRTDPPWPTRTCEHLQHLRDFTLPTWLRRSQSSHPAWLASPPGGRSMSGTYIGTWMICTHCKPKAQISYFEISTSFKLLGLPGTRPKRSNSNIGTGSSGHHSGQPIFQWQRTQTFYRSFREKAKPDYGNTGQSTSCKPTESTHGE